MYEILYAYNIAKNIPHSGYEIGTGISEQCSNVYTTLDYATDVKISNITALTWVFEREKNEMSGFIASYKEPI